MFSHTTVIAIDNSPIRLACARENAKIYGVEEYITFIQADYLDWAKTQADSTSPDKESIDVIFMSPPWGGISYQEDDDPNLTTKDPDQTLPYGDAAADAVNDPTYASYPLSRLLPKHGKELFDISRKLTKNIAYYLPRNLDIHEAAALVDPSEKVEIEEEWMGSKLKALTLYYADLVKNP
jgi:trimethylguanosine synthase